jgi:DNA-binding transcriptional regulator LsrR (DeoR family)
MKCREEAVGRFRENSMKLPVTQAQLADVLGLTPVHINRMISSLRASGLITTSSQRVTILDWRGLARAADFDPAYLHLERLPETIVH